MKTINLYYVLDRLNNTAITSIIPASEHLTACLGFRNSYILNKENKIPYKNLSLVCCGQLNVLENGAYKQNVSYEDWSISGSEVIDFIREEIANRGLDDGFLDEEDDK